jgi:hypothetical protein
MDAPMAYTTACVIVEAPSVHKTMYTIGGICCTQAVGTRNKRLFEGGYRTVGSRRGREPERKMEREGGGGEEVEGRESEAVMQ